MKGLPKLFHSFSYPFYLIVGGAIAVFIGFMVTIGSGVSLPFGNISEKLALQKNKGIQSFIVAATVTPIPTATSTPLPTETPTPIPSPTPTPLPTNTPLPTKKPVPTQPPIQTSNTPPSSGFNRQWVSAAGGSFQVDLIAGNLDSTRVIVDTASDSTCINNCPVLSLGDYVSRSGAYAGVNGSYFCPASYPQCAGKTNSFDTLLMNKNKVYFNSDNNVYSTVPAVIFQGSSVRFIERSLDWGRDTGIDSMIANQPLLVMGGQSRFGGDDDPKKSGQGTRSFVANKGNMVYIGVVRNVSVAQMASVLAALGMDNALNLDSGGSTALWFSGYKAGPGRAIPNAILFVRK